MHGTNTIITLKTFALFYKTATFIRNATKRGRHGAAAACRFLFQFYMVQISDGSSDIIHGVVQFPRQMPRFYLK